MHSLVQTYHDPAEENRDLLDQIMPSATEGFTSKGMVSSLNTHIIQFIPWYWCITFSNPVNGMDHNLLCMIKQVERCMDPLDHFYSNHYVLVVIDINQKYEYGIWLSFAEIYTEKIYDLLVPPDRHLKRRQLPLKYEFRSGHKYIAGLKQVKVQSIEVWWWIIWMSHYDRY